MTLYLYTFAKTRIPRWLRTVLVVVGAGYSALCLALYQFGVVSV